MNGGVFVAARLLNLMFECVDLEEARKNWGAWFKRFGLFVLVVCAAMALGRAFINPNTIVFPTDVGSDWDYRSMIGMGMLLIAIDAMMLVLISFRTLRTWQSVLAVSGFVATTHILYPLFTFGITAGSHYLADAGLIPYSIARGIMSGIYFIAVIFVAAHLKEVHGNIRKGEGERFHAAITTLKWSVLSSLAIAIFPEVHAVSIDALMVGPAKIAFVARYETTQFLMSFVYIGLGVGVLVMMAGFVVMAINRWIDSHEEAAKLVQKIDFVSSIMLATVFIHFTVFAAVYWLFTFWPQAWLLNASTIWGATALITAGYLLTIGSPKEVWQASFTRAGIGTN